MSATDAGNQPPPFTGINLFAADAALREAAARACPAHPERLNDFGAVMGSAGMADDAGLAHHVLPELSCFDRFGNRIDRVTFHPAYHRIMKTALEAGMSAAPWKGEAEGHALHAMLEFLLAEIEPATCCPVTMTYAAPAALRHADALSFDWIGKICAQTYDERDIPAEQKRAVTIGMAMTEKQGGSDLRANVTRAEREGAAYALTGHKWFCSAPMSDAFLTLAQTEAGPTCFLAPRWRPDGTRNAIHVMRLKDKIGDRANASSEIEYHGAYAERVGEEGRGIATILEMVHHTRLDCTIAPAAYMRSAAAQALWHTAHRTAFGKPLIDQALMRAVLADLVLESEGATALAFRIVQSFDRAQDEEEALFSRLATPIGKYWLNKRVTQQVTEAMECHGGNGYVEEWPIARLYRQAPLNGIWEGSGNIICLDVLRALNKEARTGEAFLDEVLLARGANAKLDAAIDALAARLHAGPIAEDDVRALTEDMALALQASLLVRFAPSFVADAFCAARLPRPAATYGAVAGADVEAIIERGMVEYGENT